MHKKQIWPWRKVGQSQPRIIIWNKLERPTAPMLHTKSKGHWLSGSGEEDFKGVLPYMDVAAILVMWQEPFEQTFVPASLGVSIWNLSLIEDVWKCWRTVGRRCDWYTISSPMSLRHRWAKNYFMNNVNKNKTNSCLWHYFFNNQFNLWASEMQTILLK